jgi:hypothetical protein
MGGNDNDDNRKILLCEWIVKGKIACPGIPHSARWRRIRIALRGRFYRDIRLGRVKSLGKRIFVVVF